METAAIMLDCVLRNVHYSSTSGPKQSTSLVTSVQVHAEACEAPGQAFQTQTADVPMTFSADCSCGVVYDAVMELHLREAHAEHPNRIRELNSKLEREGLLAKCQQLAPKLASTEEILKCHSQAHIDKVEQLYKNPINTLGQPVNQEGDIFIISDDVYCNKHTSTAARSAAGCSMQAVRAVLSGEVCSAFAIVRPPGHHAGPNEVQGFCFYNNVAVAAHAALDSGLDRVLIVDWDIHHGNGTQKIFEDDHRVLFVSLHRRDKDFYPEGSGYAHEVGSGRGRGFNVNIPWACDGRAMLVGDADYLAAFELILDPIILQYNPQLVLISAGFDAAQGDFLGKCHVSPAGFALMTQRLRRYAGGRVVAVLEGGYVPSIVGECATAVMQVLQGAEPQPLPDFAGYKLHKSLSKVLSKVDSVQRQHWSALAALPPFAARYEEYSNTVSMQRLVLTGSAPRRVISAATPAPAAGNGANSMNERAETPKSSDKASGSLSRAAVAEARADKKDVAAAECKAADKTATSSHGLTNAKADVVGDAQLIANVQDGTAAVAPGLSPTTVVEDGLAEALSSHSIISVQSPRNATITEQECTTEPEAAVSSDAPAACTAGAALIIVASGSCSPAETISAVPGALIRAASAMARAEKRAKAVAERKALAERRAAAQAAKLALIQAERKAQVAAARAAAFAAAEAEEKAAAAAKREAGMQTAATQEATSLAAVDPTTKNREDRVCAAALIAQHASSNIVAGDSRSCVAAVASAVQVTQR